MLGPLSRKTPKKSYEKKPFLKALELNARSPAIWWDSQWQYRRDAKTKFVYSSKSSQI
jgi:hypothetical protein